MIRGLLVSFIVSVLLQKFFKNFHSDKYNIGINGFNDTMKGLIYGVPTIICMYIGMFLGSLKRIGSLFESSDTKLRQEIEVELFLLGKCFFSNFESYCYENS